MKVHILIIFISILFTLIAAYFASEAGDGYGEKFKNWFLKLLPNFEGSSERDGLSLIRNIFYNYKHKNIDDWLAWILSQDRETKKIAFSLLKDHLEAEPMHWGNISLEVLNGISGFKEFKILDFLNTFLRRISPIWNEYKIVPSLYEKALNIFYTLDPDKAISFMSSVFSASNINSDKTFTKKAELIINIVAKDEIYASEFYTDLFNNERLTPEITNNVLRRIFNLQFNAKKLALVKILNEYINDTEKINQKNYESEDAYRNRMNNIKEIIEHCVDMISTPDLFSVLSKLTKNNELGRIIHNKILNIINNSEADLDFRKALAFNYFPDTTDEKIKFALAVKRGLPQLQVREIVTKPRIRTEEIDLAIKNHAQQLPIPAFQEKSYKRFSNKIGQDKAEILNGEKINSLLLVGDDKLCKAYFASSIAKKAGIKLTFIDCKTLKSDIDFVYAIRRIERSEGLIFIENLESLMRVVDDEFLVQVNNFLNKVKKLLKTKQYRGLLSFNHSRDEINRDLKCEIFFNRHIKEIINDIHEVESPKNYKEEIMNHYSKFLAQEDQDFSVFFEEFNESRIFKNELDYEFSCIDELSTQLLVYGEPRSFAEIDQVRRSLFEKVS